MSTPRQPHGTAPPPVGRPLFRNQVTTCPVCLESCDLTAQDIVSFHPPYLAPYDTLRAYDGFYHRACLYRTGDYSRIIEAWHQGEQGMLTGESPAEVFGFERDIACLLRPGANAVELMLFPRYARLMFENARELDDLLWLLETFIKAPNRREFAQQRGAMIIRSVGNHDALTLRWLVPLRGLLTYPLETVRAARLPRRWRSWFGATTPLDLAEPRWAKPQAEQWTGGHLESEADWRLTPLKVRYQGKEERGDAAVLRVEAHRLRFVPIWDDEAVQLVTFLHEHGEGIRARLTDLPG